MTDYTFRKKIAPYGPEKCPKCGVDSEPFDWNEVDIGVGTQTFDHQWVCTTHGVFTYVMLEGETKSRPFFQGEELEVVTEHPGYLIKGVVQ